MASIQNNPTFRSLLLRKHGATGAELQACTGRAYTYSLWSLRCMQTATRKLVTIKRQPNQPTPYMLLPRASVPPQTAIESIDFEAEHVVDHYEKLARRRMQRAEWNGKPISILKALREVAADIASRLARRTGKGK
jgi:hypothetical protein